MTLKDALSFGVRTLSGSSSARLDSEILLSYVLRRPVTFLLAHDETPLSYWHFWRFRRLLSKRKRGVPVAYLIHSRDFFGYAFYVNEHVLVPRPDTEILVERVRDVLRTLPHPFLMDVGTGSGCIPISLLKEIPSLKALALDVSKSALKVAQKNAKLLQVQDRIRFRSSNLLRAVSCDEFQGQDLVITANLPYLPESFEKTSGLEYEPQIALWAGQEGLDFYRPFLKQILPFRPQRVFLELFDFQIEPLLKEFPEFRKILLLPMSGQARLLELTLV